jgi:photosystem II stability/assembly factor-like uncharacterized protein
MQKVPWKNVAKVLLVLIFTINIIQTSGNFGAEPALALTPWDGRGEFADIAAQEDDGEISIYLPAVNQPLRVELGDVWTTEGTGAVMDAFLPDKVIRYYGKGYVNVKEGVTVNLRWSIIGPCGSTTLANETVQLSQGPWMLYRSNVAPNCPGIYVYTLRMEYADNVSFLTIPYVINNPSEISTIRIQGFDKCNIPYGTKSESVSQMQTWWTQSPYYATNLYIGGVSRYCSNTELDAVWVNMVARQGWSFIPTWVGPQAPCTSFRNKFSYNLATAYQQGILEANAAVTATRNLGFLGNAVIYYDMEVYSTTNSECREAVKSFLAGWTQRVKENDLRSGVYGHRINVNDWALIYPVPDSVWIAYWVYPFAYNPYASAYNIPGVSDSLWYGHRIRQYTGGHTETYGGLTFNIDSNITHGDVTVLSNSLVGTPSELSVGIAGEALRADSEATLVSSDFIQDMQLLSERAGWALVNYQLLWTDDGGDHWVEITPALAIPGTLMAVKFLDEENGWAVSQDPLTGQLDIYQTNDSGKQWQVSLLQEGNLDYGPMASEIYLEFLDQQNGWVVVKLISSSNFSIGSLYRTHNGGESWEALSLPIGEPVRFLDQKRGWVAGGPAGDELYISDDGGNTWLQVQITDHISQVADHVLVNLPIFSDDRNGILPITVMNTGMSQVEILKTQNGGTTWESHSVVYQRDISEVGENVILSNLDGSTIFTIDTNSSKLVRLNDNYESMSVFEQSKLPDRVGKIELAEDGFAWAIVREGNCSGDKVGLADAILLSYDSYRCENSTRLLRTTDNGETWTDIAPSIMPSSR